MCGLILVHQGPPGGLICHPSRIGPSASNAAAWHCSAPPAHPLSPLKLPSPRSATKLTCTPCNTLHSVGSLDFACLIPEGLSLADSFIHLSTRISRPRLRYIRSWVTPCTRSSMSFAAARPLLVIMSYYISLMWKHVSTVPRRLSI